MANFGRYQEWSDLLTKVQTHFRNTVQRYNGAVIVYYPAKERTQHHRTIGVTRLLANYYRPSAEEEAKINAAVDKGKELGFFAFRHCIDKYTFEARFRKLAETKYETYDDTIVAMNALKEVNMIAIGSPEFLLGSRNIFVKEEPREGAEWLHLTGSIDMLCYNTLTGKLALVELKSSSGFTSNNSNAKFMSMQTLHLKEKHCKQLCLYTKLFIAMAAEIGIVVPPADLELVIIANNKTKHKLAIWEMPYDPITFLGSVWARDRWYGITDTGALFFKVQDIAPRCSVCKGDADILKTKSLPIIFICIKCKNANLCKCGKLARLKSKTHGKICSANCPRLPKVIEIK
jgi:hypothetical protein